MSTPGVSRSSPDLSAFLTRNEASDLLGCSVSTFINWERQGLLTAYKGMRGNAREVILYDPKQLARMPRKRAAPLSPGELESRAFEMFDRGYTIRTVVIQLRITADEAWAIRERWIDAGGATTANENATTP
jgi:phage terminase Nu1 subunit (DNA packaging protein)